MKIYAILAVVIVGLSFSVHSLYKNNGSLKKIAKEATELAQKTQESYEKELKNRSDLQDKFNEVSKNAKDKLNQSHIDLNNSRDASKRLQEQLNKARTAANSATATLARIDTARNSTDMCPELFSRIDDLATEYADYADRSRIAGISCENQYNSLLDYLSYRNNDK